MVSDALSRLFNLAGGKKSIAATAASRQGSVDAAVAWWVESLRGRDGVEPAPLDLFAHALSDDLTARLDATYRVYLEVNHQPKGVLRTVALTAGLSVDAFPTATTMSVTDKKVEVSRAAGSPYELLHTA
jgi:hypothetical protein